jgi:hypothetical protein
MMLRQFSRALLVLSFITGVAVMSVVGTTMIRPENASAAAVECFSVTGTGTGEPYDCDRAEALLLNQFNVESLSQLADRCFAISISIVEIDCETDVAEANAARCIKENEDRGRYLEIACSSSGVTHDFRQGNCYAITSDNQVIETECNDDEWINYIAGSYAGGANDSSASYNNAPTTCTGGDISNSDNCPIVGYIVLAINVLSGAVGLIITAVIIASGIQYSSSRDDPQAVAAAKGRIYSAVLALAVFIFAWTILQWLVPGGVLNT